MNRVIWNNVLFDEGDEKLIFVDQEITVMPDAIVNLYHSRVRKVDLSFNQLQSLDGLELFARLEELILDNNQLGDNIRIPKTQSITTLSLNNNKITNLNILLIKLSTFLPNIKYLSLLGNSACPNEFFASKTDYQNYRYFVISALPHLKFLDSSKVSSFERENADELSTVEENPFLKYFDPKNIFKGFTKSRNVLYSPLPDSFRAAGEHRARSVFKLSTFLPNIKYLSLLGNSACPNEFFASKTDYQNYRYFVISALPHLKFLDSSKVSSFERENADELSTVEENPFLKYFDPKNIFKGFTKSRNVLYSPLPDSFRAAGEHRGVYRKCRCKYVGDQSEGNRFISNKDL